MIGMHIPDGFINGPTSLVAGLVAIAGVALCLRKTSETLDDREIPVVGLAAAFVFAAQMINFPVASGTSGHLMGGVLAAVLVGPWAGGLAVTIVLSVQALLFADGGLSALGLNVVNMALAGAFVGYAIFVVLRKALGNTATAVTVASGIAGFLVPLIATAMFGVHALIGIGEGIITFLAIGAVMNMRPDLVYGARGVRTRTARTALQGAPS